MFLFFDFFTNKYMKKRHNFICLFVSNTTFKCAIYNILPENTVFLSDFFLIYLESRTFLRFELYTLIFTKKTLYNIAVK